MKTQLIVLITVLIASMYLAGCAEPATQPPPTQLPPTQAPPTQPLPTQAPPTQPPAAQIPPTKPPVGQETPQPKLNAEIVQKMVDQLNAGDVEGSLAYFTDDARIYLYGFPPTGFELYKGKDQIRAFWQDMVNNHFQWEVKVTTARGDQVNLQAKTWHDFTRQIGVAPLEYYDIYQVIDGKITSYSSWLTVDSLARFRPAFAAAVPPEPTATPVSDPGVSEMTVTIAGGVCTTDNPVALKAGEVTVNVNVEDQDRSDYAVGLFNLDPGKDLLDLTVALYSVLPNWSEFLLEVYPGPGQSETYTFTLENGPVYMICLSKPPDIIIGNAGPIPVVQ